MAKPFMTITVNVTKKQFEELCLPIREALENYDVPVLREAGISVPKLMQELYQDQTFIDAVKDTIKGNLKERIDDYVDDPYGYDFEEVTNDRLTKIFEHLDEVNSEYQEQREIERAAKNFDNEVNATAQQLKAAIELLKSSGVLDTLLAEHG